MVQSAPKYTSKISQNIDLATFPIYAVERGYLKIIIGVAYNLILLIEGNKKCSL